jgi:hypothetical protein
VVRPEPHQPFDKTQIGPERCIDPCLCVLQEDLLGNPGTDVRLLGLSGGICLHGIVFGAKRGVCHLAGGWARGGRRTGLRLALLGGQTLRLALLSEIERGTRGFAAA